MAHLRQRYLKPAIAVASAVLAAIIIIAVLVGQVDKWIPDRVTQNAPAPAITAGASAGPNGSSDVMTLHGSAQPVPALYAHDSEESGASRIGQGSMMGMTNMMGRMSEMMQSMNCGGAAKPNEQWRSKLSWAPEQ